MSDPLTVAEVATLARRAQQRLRSLQGSSLITAEGWRLVERAQEPLGELLLLCDLVELQHEGVLAVADDD